MLYRWRGRTTDQHSHKNFTYLYTDHHYYHHLNLHLLLHYRLSGNNKGCRGPRSPDVSLLRATSSFLPSAVGLCYPFSRFSSYRARLYPVVRMTIPRKLRIHAKLFRMVHPFFSDLVEVDGVSIPSQPGPYLFFSSTLSRSFFILAHLGLLFFVMLTCSSHPFIPFTFTPGFSGFYIC